MEKHTIPVGHLVLPILLPLAQSGFLQQAVCLDNQFWSGGLKAHASLYTYYSVAHVAVAADGVGCANLLYLLYGLHLVVKHLTVDSLYLALFKRNLQQRLLLLGHVLEISLLGQSLCRVEQFAAADARAPDAHVVGILQLGEVGREAVVVQIVHLFLSRQSLVACESDYLHTRSHHEECHVETNLVVAGTCGTVGYGVGTYLVGVARYGYGLEYALRRHRYGVAVVAQHVAEYHVLE